MTTPIVDKVVEAYRRFSKIPIPLKGYLSPRQSGHFQATVIQSQPDLERSENIKSLKNYTIDNKTLATISSYQAIDVTTEQKRCEAPLGNKIAILRKIQTAKSEEKQFLEVWVNSVKTLNLDLSALDIHGNVYEDDQFGCLQWSPDSTKILYVAEKKQPKSESFFKTKQDGVDAQSKTPVIPGNEYLYLQDWGEALVGKHQPLPFIVDVDTSKINPVEGLPNEITFGQGIWTPDSKGIICVGWDQTPKRLGITYCFNRKSALYHIVLDEKKCEIISNMNKSVHSPRFSLNGSTLAYLESEAGGPHNKGSRLMTCDWNTKQTDIIIDLVWNGSDEPFPGIYANLLPPHIWTNDNDHVVFHSVLHSREELVCINISSKKVNRLEGNFKDFSWNLLDILDDTLLATISSPDKSPINVIGTFSSSDKSTVNWIKLDQSVDLPNIEWNVLKLKPFENSIHPKYQSVLYEAILIKPKNPQFDDGKMPLIVWPHGGPHASHLAAFNLFTSIATHLGFACLLVNFRGSTGFGEDSIYSLLGNVGDYDVKDCQRAVEEVALTSNFSSFVLYGGSHGGFLVTHLIGQYPDFYRACVCRNPVVDIPGKLTISDIPDWSWVECGLNYDFMNNGKPADLTTMWEKSPIKYVDNVKTPVLLTIGKLDLRVPPSQGLTYYHALKARNVDVKLLIYEDNHSLSKTNVHADGLVNSILWFFQHLKE